MKIEIKNLKITNFKGIKSLEFNFNDQTTIEGQNKTGKSTIVDAVIFLLHGKNAEDKKDFCIKPLDKDNNVIPKLENIVEANLLIDGLSTILKKTHREKWQKKHGDLESSFIGNETLYEINGVPKKQKEYHEFVNGLIDEKLFKLVTSPTYFNSLHWDIRRQMLIDLVGNINDNDVIEMMPNVEHGDTILFFLNQNKTLIDAKKEISAKTKRIKSELALIPSRIDEAQRNKPDVLDFAKLNKDLEVKQTELAKIDKKLQDKSEATKLFYEDKSSKQKEVGEINEAIVKLKNDNASDFNSKKQEITNSLTINRRELELLVAPKTAHLTSYENVVNKLTEANKLLRQEWDDINDSVFEINESDKICPTCKQELSNLAEVSETLKENFNLENIKKKEKITTEGKENAAEIKLSLTKIEEHIDSVVKFDTESINIGQSIKNLETQLLNLTLPPLNSVELGDLNTKKESKELEIDSMIPIDNPFELNEQKKGINQEIDALKAELLKETRINEINNRVQELNNSEKEKAQAIADLERTELAIMNFVQTKMSFIEDKVNGMFELCKFKMFETQINGARKEACETLVNGVPYNSDLNTGHKVLGGLDIIKTFSKHYNISAPVFVDNAESVTEEFPQMDAQMVYLYAKKGVKTLKIS